MKHLTHDDILDRAQIIAELINKKIPNATNASEDDRVKIYAIPRGGIPAAYIIYGYLTELTSVEIVSNPKDANILIDDLIDSGKTKERYLKKYPHIKHFFALYEKGVDIVSDWLVFPWESKDEDQSAEDIPIRILQRMGLNANDLPDFPKKFLDLVDEFSKIRNL